VGWWEGMMTTDLRKTPKVGATQVPFDSGPDRADGGTWFPLKRPLHCRWQARLASWVFLFGQDPRRWRSGDPRGRAVALCACGTGKTLTKASDHWSHVNRGAGRQRSGPWRRNSTGWGRYDRLDQLGRRPPFPRGVAELPRQTPAGRRALDSARGGGGAGGGGLRGNRFSNPSYFFTHPTVKYGGGNAIFPRGLALAWPTWELGGDTTR